MRDNFDVTFFCGLYKYVETFSKDNPDLKKIIFFDYCEDPNTALLPKSKMICFKWEAIKIPLRFYDFYYRVYTFDDDLIDNVKFFKFYYPVLQPMLADIPTFNEKKLCAWVATNWIPKRLEMLDFFSTLGSDALHLYGVPPPQYRNSDMDKGLIPGFYSGEEKLHVLKNYKFCICFENTHTTPGYITEKIFDAFAAGCVPIYWGPNNIEQYVPDNCFIDYRKFENNQKMYEYITSMTALEYEQYIENIRIFLQSDKAYLFSQENFERILYDAASS